MSRFFSAILSLFLVAALMVMAIGLVFCRSGPFRRLRDQSVEEGSAPGDVVVLRGTRPERLLP